MALLFIFSEQQTNKDRELVEARRRVSSAQEEVTKLKHALHKELGLAEGDKLPYEKVRHSRREKEEEGRNEVVADC